VTFSFRLATTDDARAAATAYEGSGLPGAPASPAEFERLTQTGHAFLVAEAEGRVFGAIRVREDEGIAWFDLLVSRRPWAGAQLVRAVERRAQDRGIRLVRAVCPDGGILPDYFARLGYLPIGRHRSAAGQAELLLERRLPLLTVREQRRSDAQAIASLTGEDPWVFEQGARPGWFVVSDGDRVVGAIQVRDGGSGLARMTVPALLPGYRGRQLELWMLERAATYAETNGYHTAEVEAVADLDPLKREMEDRRWFREGGIWRRVFFTPRVEEDD
jgi:ribosomal protein S18 acetylase RimI-like enzyme